MAVLGKHTNVTGGGWIIYGSRFLDSHPLTDTYIYTNERCNYLSSWPRANSCDPRVRVRRVCAGIHGKRVKTDYEEKNVREL